MNCEKKKASKREKTTSEGRSANDERSQHNTEVPNPSSTYNPRRTLGTPGAPAEGLSTTQQRGLAHTAGLANPSVRSVVFGHSVSTQEGVKDKASTAAMAGRDDGTAPGWEDSRAPMEREDSTASTAALAGREDGTAPGWEDSRAPMEREDSTASTAALAGREDARVAATAGTGSAIRSTHHGQHTSASVPSALLHTDRKDRKGTDRDSTPERRLELLHTEASSQLIPTGTNPPAQAYKAEVDITGMTPSYGFFLKRLHRLHGGAISLELQNMMASSRNLPQGRTLIAPDSDSASEDAATDSRIPTCCTSSFRPDSRLVTVRGEQDMGTRSPTGDSGGVKPEGNHSRQFRATKTLGRGQREGHRLNWERHHRTGSPPIQARPGIPSHGYGDTFTGSHGRRDAPRRTVAPSVSRKGQGEAKSTGRRVTPAVTIRPSPAFTGSSGHGNRGRRMTYRSQAPHGQMGKHEANTPSGFGTQNNTELVNMERAQVKGHTKNRTRGESTGFNIKESAHPPQQRKRKDNKDATMIWYGNSTRNVVRHSRVAVQYKPFCIYCGGKGHLAIECRHNPFSARNRKKSKVCHYCGQAGHRTRHCKHNPYSRVNKRKAQQADQAQVTKGTKGTKLENTLPVRFDRLTYSNEDIRRIGQATQPPAARQAGAQPRSRQVTDKMHGHNYRGRFFNETSRAHGHMPQQVHNPPTKTEICTRCHQPGHIAEHCTATLKLAKEKRHGETALKAPGPLQCYRCCRTGHTAENCTTRAIPRTASHQLKPDGQQSRTQEYEHVGLVLETSNDNQNEERKSHTTTVDLGQESSGSSASRTEEGEEEVRTNNPGQRTQRGQEGDDEQDIKPMLGTGERPYKPIFIDPNVLRLNLSADQHRVYKMIAQLETALNRENNPLKRALNTRMERIEANLGTLTNRLNAQRDAILDLQTIVDLACTCVEELQFSTRTLPTDMAAQENLGHYLFKKIREVYAQWGWPLPTGNSVFSQNSDNYSAQSSQRNMDTGNWELDEDGTPIEHMELGASASNAQRGDPGLNQHGGMPRRYDPLTDDAGAVNVAGEHNDHQQVVANANGAVNPNPNGEALVTAQDGDGGNFDLRMTRGGVLYAAPTDPRNPQGTAGGGQDQTAQLPQQPPQNHAQLRQQRGYGDQERCGALGVSTWKGTYNGTPEDDIELFIEEFELHAKAMKVDKSEWATLLRLKLTGLARSTAAAMSSPDKEDYDKIKDKLMEAFSRQDRYLTARDSIRHLRYTGSFNDFVAQLAALMPKAYPRVSQEARDMKTFDILMENIPYNLMVEVKRQGCETLANLTRTAPKAEAFLKDVSGQRQKAQPVTATFLNQEETNVGIVGTDYSAPNAPHPYKGDQVTPARNKQGRRTQPRDGGRPQNFNQPRGQPGRNNQWRPQQPPAQAQLICGYCGKQGHAQIWCRQYNRAQAGNRNDFPPQVNRTQRTRTFGQPGHNPQLTCYTCGQFGHIARICPFGQPQMDQYGQNPIGQLQGQFQQLQLQQAPQQQQMLRRQPYQTAAIMLPQQQQMDMPHQSTSAPMVLNTGQTYTQQAQMQQQQQQLYPRQQQVQPTVMVPPSTSTNIGNTNAIAQATGTENDTAQAEDEASAKKLTEEDIKEMKGTMRLLTSKLYLKADQESPSLDILATLTRHENGHEPEFIPVDYRLVTIPVIVHGHECTALFDSGSSITIAPIALAEILEIKVEDSDKSIKSVTGHVASANKRGQARLTMAGHTRDVEIHFTGNFLGTKNPYDLIIGVDTMRHFPSVTLNVQERKLTIGHNTLCWKTKGELLREERKVFVTHELVVPPNSQAVVGAFIDNSKGEVTPTVTIEKTGTNPIEVVCSLTDVDSDNRCKLVICNPHKAPITIRPYEVIGLASNTIEDNGDIGNIPEITAAMAQGFKRAQDIDPTYVVDYSKTDCTEGQQVQLRKLLERYSNAFSKNGYDLGTARVNAMQIRTTTDVPFRPSIYTTDKGIRDKVRQELEHMKDMGCIVESNTPWLSLQHDKKLSPLVMVKKKTAPKQAPEAQAQAKAKRRGEGTKYDLRQFNKPDGGLATG